MYFCVYHTLRCSTDGYPNNNMACYHSKTSVNNQNVLKHKTDFFPFEGYRPFQPRASLRVHPLSGFTAHFAAVCIFIQILRFAQCFICCPESSYKNSIIRCWHKNTILPMNFTRTIAVSFLVDIVIFHGSKMRVSQTSLFSALRSGKSSGCDAPQQYWH